ncbi:hypothetical protein BN946_scf184834.g1, partial [Trametes cinnabarina]
MRASSSRTSSPSCDTSNSLLLCRLSVALVLGVLSTLVAGRTVSVSSGGLDSPALDARGSAEQEVLSHATHSGGNGKGRNGDRKYENGELPPVEDTVGWVDPRLKGGRFLD